VGSTVNGTCGPSSAIAAGEALAALVQPKLAVDRARLVAAWRGFERAFEAMTRAIEARSTRDSRPDDGPSRRLRDVAALTGDARCDRAAARLHERSRQARPRDASAAILREAAASPLPSAARELLFAIVLMSSVVHDAPEQEDAELLRRMMRTARSALRLVSPLLGPSELAIAERLLPDPPPQPPRPQGYA